MAILVCGGAGYIGSHTVALLKEQGREVIVIDSLYKGHKDAIVSGVKFYQGDLRDKVFLTEVFSENDIDAIIDFAADSLVGESVNEPLKYYNNNVYGTLCLLEVMKVFGVKYIVFSSTAATFGEPKSCPILENADTVPTNPYGETKLTVEKMLYWCSKAYDFHYTVLRYFNAAGAHMNGQIGEDHNPESHLIPLILQVALGKRKQIEIFGDDYPTIDGSCVRDYIHVTDLSEAHILALDKMMITGESSTYNLGNGLGFSVKEVLEVARKVTGHPIPSVISERRAGDPAILIASSEKATNELNWHPKYNTLEKIIETAWSFHNNHPNGY
ncbi:MAG: UDP-glucose 4-epimerase GalE [Firmicutes bacterium HGW-Firmicutes-1]|jgi:UDP-glucose 4-epimerase|nr:MAG: UDP-glucose 4-epimerase GalE [Firmicutes bacterium HGW-Firmicutes-1]